MFQILLALILAGAAGWLWFTKTEIIAKQFISGFVGVLALGMVASISFLYVDKDEIGLLDRVYFGSDMAVGQVVAKQGQKGPQAETIPPGFHFIPFVRFLYDIDYQPMINIPAGNYGQLEALDGKPLREGQIIADGWDNYTDMLDAEKFLEKGQKGPQLTVLPPGNYRYNPYLFRIKMGQAIAVRTGEVAVIRSNVTTKDKCETAIATKGVTTALVPKGCKGVWNEPLYQGMYYLNELAYKATYISTRVNTWAYKGGYTARKIDLKIQDNGKITQTETEIEKSIPQGAASGAINVRVEGWTVPVELRITAQVSPENAPKVVAGVGTLQKVEDNIVTPVTRNKLRTVGGAKGARVLDFVEKRDSIAKTLLGTVRLAAEDAGVSIIDINMGEPAIPPELLVPNQRKQIADQLKITYKTEKAAQGLRIKTERERATADQQKDLVKAEIAKRAAKELKEKRRLEGEGEKLYLTQLADGEKARKNVLGENNVVKLKLMEMIVANPAIVKVPHIVVGQGAGGFEGAAAILGNSSNAAKLLNSLNAR